MFFIKTLSKIDSFLKNPDKNKNLLIDNKVIIKIFKFKKDEIKILL